MISNKSRESKRIKNVKMSKNLERLYKEVKCREFSILVKKMDFAKILGKFTKVKIQYEIGSTPKGKKDTEPSSPNARLKGNENGMVLLHRNAYNKHPVKDLLSSKNNRSNGTSSPRQVANILKENNRLKKPPAMFKDYTFNHGKRRNNNLKHYGIIFENPCTTVSFDTKSKISLPELVPLIDSSILPSDDWSIDYFPKHEEPKDDKVYDRIAAELEDLMYSEKTVKVEDKKAVDDKIVTENKTVTENKSDEFPSIMDILNDNSVNSESIQKTNEQNNSIDIKSALESSDVEAMLLGKADIENNKDNETMAMEVENSDVPNLLEDVAQLNPIPETENSTENKALANVQIENPQSPSILEESSPKDEERKNCKDQESMECEVATEKEEKQNMDVVSQEEIINEAKPKSMEQENKLTSIIDISQITHMVFSKTKDGKSYKSVTCPKNLKYSIELEGKPVVFLGAPRLITSIEDLQVLLQIVNETDLNSLYVSH